MTFLNRKSDQSDPEEPALRRLVEAKRAMQPTADAIQASLQSYRNVLKWKDKRRDA